MKHIKKKKYIIFFSSIFDRVIEFIWYIIAFSQKLQRTNPSIDFN